MNKILLLAMFCLIAITRLDAQCTDCNNIPPPYNECTPPTSGYDAVVTVTGNQTWTSLLAGISHEDMNKRIRIIGTGTLRVVNGNLKMSTANSLIVVDGPELIINNGNLVFEKGSVGTFRNVRLRTFGNIQQSEGSTLCITNSEVECGEESANGRFNTTGNQYSAANFQNDKGRRYLNTVCMNVTHDYQLQSGGGQDILVNVCAEIGDKGGTHARTGVLDGDDSGNFQNSADMRIYNSKFWVIENVQNQSSGRMLTCDVSFRTTNGNFQNNGNLPGCDLCVWVDNAHLMQNDGNWTATFKKRRANTQGSYPNLPANSSATDIASCFTICCDGGLPLGSIGDLVYCDNNCNAVFDAGDIPQSGVLVTLCNASNVVISTTTTNASGIYSFSSLISGTYIVKFPATITGGKTINTSNPITVNLAAGQNFLDADAGYKPACNINIDITQKICNNNNTPSNPNDDTYTFVLTVTGGTGTWSGSYSNAYLGVFQFGPTPYNTPINLGPFPAGPFTTSNTNPPIVLPNGLDISLNINDVQNPCCTKSATVTSTGNCSNLPLLGSIGDFTYCDNNGNAVYDAGDTPQSGVLVTLCNANNVFITSTTTNASGIYTFPNLTAATYIVKFPSTLTGGKTITTFPDLLVPLSPGEQITWADAGYKPAALLGSIGDFTYCDNNGNAVYDAGDTPQSGVLVTLCNANNVFITSTTTNASGIYTFPNLTAATYIVKFPSTLTGGKTITTFPDLLVPLSPGEQITWADAGYKPATCPDGSPKKTPGTACNDGNSNTTNDKILADGCTCQGTPIVDCNAPRSNTISKSCSGNVLTLNGSALVNYEYMWLSSTIGCPSSPSQAIPGATSQNYILPSAVTQTTYFTRCARPIGCTTWGAITESNCLTVNPTECGTPSNPCSSIVVVGSYNGVISVKGLGSYISIIKVINSQGQSVVNQQFKTSTVSIPIKNGTYTVKVQLYSNSQYICEKIVKNVYVSGSANLTSQSVLELHAAAELHRVRLEWVNNTGYKNDYFIVQRLNNSSGIFEDVEIINVNLDNNDLKSFVSYDNKPQNDINYYRIKLVQLDKRELLSATIKVNFLSNSELIVFPNPTNEIVMVDLAKYKGQSVGIYLYNQFGQQVLFKQFEQVDSEPISLDISNHQAGNYVIRVISKGKKDAVKKLQITR